MPTSNWRRQHTAAETYSIVRFYRDASPNRRVIKRGLSLDEAQAHCRDPETSSSTCKTAAAKAITARVGQWFDGYEKEGN